MVAGVGIGPWHTGKGAWPMAMRRLGITKVERRCVLRGSIEMRHPGIDGGWRVVVETMHLGIA